MSRGTLQAPPTPEAPGAAPDRRDAAAAPAGRPPWHRTPAGEYALIALVFLGFLALWAGVARAMGLSSLVLPTPLVVWRALVEGLASGLLLAHLWVTLQEILLGFLLGCCLGVGMGTLVAHSVVHSRVQYP